MTDTRKVKTDRLRVAAQRGDGWARRRLRRLDIQTRLEARAEVKRDHPRRTRAARRRATADTRHARRSARMALRQAL